MQEKFAILGQPKRVWAVGNTLGNIIALQSLHDYMADQIHPGDRLVYCGGYVGAYAGFEACDELLTFRRCILSAVGMAAHDLVYLRGPAEEAWVRMFRLTYSSSPERDLNKLLEAGARDYLYAYGIRESHAHKVMRGGTSVIARWLNELRNLVRTYPGHDAFWNSMRRAAYTQNHYGQADGTVFVPAGFNPAACLEDQNESLWKTDSGFETIHGPCQDFNRVVRGLDRAGFGLDMTAHTLSLDCAQGDGPSHAVCLNRSGQILALLSTEAGRVYAEDLNRLTPRHQPFTERRLAA